VPPHVKTSLAPGSRVVTDYYEKSGLDEYLNKVGFYTVGYGCTTCIGNSGPLPEPISAAVKKNDLVVAGVLSGNRNFEGRINPDVKANYLASPPLVVAYALAGTTDIDFEKEPIGSGTGGAPVYLREIWPTQAEVQAVVAHVLHLASNKVVVQVPRMGGAFGGKETQAACPAALAALAEDRRRHQGIDTAANDHIVRIGHVKLIQELSFPLVGKVATPASGRGAGWG